MKRQWKSLMMDCGWGSGVLLPPKRPASNDTRRETNQRTWMSNVRWKPFCFTLKSTKRHTKKTKSMKASSNVSIIAINWWSCYLIVGLFWFIIGLWSVQQDKQNPEDELTPCAAAFSLHHWSSAAPSSLSTGRWGLSIGAWTMTTSWSRLSANKIQKWCQVKWKPHQHTGSTDVQPSK